MVCFGELNDITATAGTDFFKYLKSSLLAFLHSEEEASGSERAEGSEASSYCKTSCN